MKLFRRRNAMEARCAGGLTRGLTGCIRAIVAVSVLFASVLFGRGEVFASTVSLDLRNCYLTVHFLKEPGERGSAHRLEQFVDDSYRESLARDPDGSARLDIWALKCESISINGAQRGPGMLSLLSIRIVDRPAHHLYAGISDYYLVRAHTDRMGVAKVLRDAGVAVDLVQHMQLEWRSEGLTKVSIPWAPSPYELAVRGLPGTNTPHSHDNTFQHVDRVLGLSTIELKVPLPEAQDLLCVAKESESGWDRDASCGVKAKPGTFMANVLGDNEKTEGFDSTAKTTIAADHDRIVKATLTVVFSGDS